MNEKTHWCGIAMGAMHPEVPNTTVLGNWDIRIWLAAINCKQLTKHWVAWGFNKKYQQT